VFATAGPETRRARTVQDARAACASHAAAPRG